MKKARTRFRMTPIWQMANTAPKAVALTLPGTSRPLGMLGKKRMRTCVMAAKASAKAMLLAGPAAETQRLDFLTSPFRL